MTISALSLCFVLLLSEAICGIVLLLAVRYAINPLLVPLTQQTHAVAAAVASLTVTQRATNTTLEFIREELADARKKTTGWGQ